ncbi:hypothetical protein AGMMS50268_38610 [Spirochaetia bacterium]|nr:hypothetical protein FACS189491_06690 [Spirochaetia bacterium]GHV88116.1 hypothetical protein AGMMS50267_04760 [Spirochaetia bacterium]GHV93358.1 hypothetical protein AGMMS50268_38610 [Spirochaetia bacterium]
MIDKRLKPVLIKFQRAGQFEDAELFQTIKDFYDKYATQLTYPDYHHFRGVITKRALAYNCLVFSRILGMLKFVRREWLLPEEFSGDDLKTLAEIGFFIKRNALNRKTGSQAPLWTI